VTEAPEYWWQLTGGAAIVVIVAGLAAVVLLAVLVMLMLELRRSLTAITNRVQTIADRVDSVAKQVEHVTTEVGSRTVGIVRTVDDIAASAFQVVEKYAPIVIAVGAILKLRQMFGKKK
jgi:CII-binding regulator of phage lambda lysogenization HflD